MSCNAPVGDNCKHTAEDLLILKILRTFATVKEIEDAVPYLFL